MNKEPIDEEKVIVWGFIVFGCLATLLFVIAMLSMGPR